MLRFFLQTIQALFIFVVAVVVTVLMGAIILKPKLDQEIHKMIQSTRGKNLEINFFDYGKIYPSVAGIVFWKIRARGITRIEHPYFDPREFELSIPSIRVGLKGLSFKSFKIQVEVLGLEIKGGRRLHEDIEDHERLESVSRVHFKTVLELPWLPTSWKERVLKRAREFKDWVFNDRSIRDMKLKGSAVFVIDDWPVTVRFYSVASPQGDIHLEGNEEDLRVIAEMIEPKFTEADLKLASRNLLKGPKLLRFRIAAEAQAIRLRHRDSEIVYDIPRHIFWSYYLAKAYGGDFAREATNAHELGDKTNSTEESEKDRHHNALGIEYAERKLSEEQVEKMIFSDPRVFRIGKDGKFKPRPADQTASTQKLSPLSAA